MAVSATDNAETMYEYDAAFKRALQSVDLTLRDLTGTTVVQWLNVELPDVQNPRVDLLGRTPDGEIVQIELQSTNDADMPLRMAEYCLRIFRSLRRFPLQVVLYAGEAPLRMKADLSGAGMRFAYRLVDVRDLDGERLLDSPRVGDNIIAILTGLPDSRAAVRRVVERIARLEGAEREAALAQLLILAGLRKLGHVVEEEAKKMPILNDILDHEVLGREYKRGLHDGVEQGREQGVRQGIEQGVQQGELNVLRRLIAKRFGSVPGWVDQRVQGLSAAELADLSERVLDAPAIDALFTPPAD